MKLFVDDIRNAPDGWILARTVTEAIRYLTTFNIEEISLDHDISHSVIVNDIARPYPCGETFEPVARYVALGLKTGSLSMRRIILHSANPVGIKKMNDILEPVIKTIPGCLLEIKLGSPCNKFEKTEKCERCEGSDRTWVQKPGHEECCGPEIDICPNCDGRGYE